MVNAQVSCSHQPSHSAFDLKSASLPTPLYYCAKNTVLKVFETERNMFYIHKGSKMYTSQSILRAYTVAVCLLQCSFSCLVGTVLSLWIMHEGGSFHLRNSSCLLSHVLFHTRIRGRGWKVFPFLSICISWSLHVHFSGSNASGTVPRQSNSTRIWWPNCQFYFALFWHFDSPRFVVCLAPCATVVSSWPLTFYFGRCCCIWSDLIPVRNSCWGRVWQRQRQRQQCWAFMWWMITIPLITLMLILLTPAIQTFWVFM